MGLLDDAIREHLELKRQHGADASEVARQEHEALGPVRREDIAIPDPGAAPPAVTPEAEVEPAAAVVEEPVAPRSLYEDPEPVAPAPPVVEEPGQRTVAFSLDDLHAADAEADRLAAEAAAPPAPEATPAEAARAEPAPASPPEPAAAPPAVEPPATQELAWDAPATPEPAADAEPTVAPDVVPADEEPGEHDELEETPDFLQETPEHDRLWFEQKPPRDFDF